jgi:hypothetical protein
LRPSRSRIGAAGVSGMSITAVAVSPQQHSSVEFGLGNKHVEVSQTFSGAAGHAAVARGGICSGVGWNEVMSCHLLPVGQEVLSVPRQLLHEIAPATSRPSMGGISGNDGIRLAGNRSAEPASSPGRSRSLAGSIRSKPPSSRRQGLHRCSLVGTAGANR